MIQEAEVEREVKKCPGCKHDFWRDELTSSGYCTECKKDRGRKSSAKHRNADPESYREYMRDYRVRRRESGAPIHYPVRPELI